MSEKFVFTPLDAATEMLADRTVTDLVVVKTDFGTASRMLNKLEASLAARYNTFNGNGTPDFAFGGKTALELMDDRRIKLQNTKPDYVVAAFKPNNFEQEEFVTTGNFVLPLRTMGKAVLTAARYAPKEMTVKGKTGTVVTRLTRNTTIKIGQNPYFERREPATDPVRISGDRVRFNAYRSGRLSGH